MLALRRATRTEKRKSGVGKKSTHHPMQTQVVSIPAPTPMSQQVYQLAKAAKMDTGYIDVSPAGGALDTSGFMTLLNPVPQGAAVVQRVGKKILLKGLQIRGLLYNNASAYANDVALIVVYDKRPTGSPPAITDILNSISASSMNKDDNASRFRIIRRLDGCLVGNNTTMTAASAISFDEYVDLKKAPTIYKSAGTGAVGDISEGALWLIGVGESAAGATAATASLRTRVRFYDL